MQDERVSAGLRANGEKSVDVQMLSHADENIYCRSRFCTVAKCRDISRWTECMCDITTTGKRIIGITVSSVTSNELSIPAAIGVTRNWPLDLLLNFLPNVYFGDIRVICYGEPTPYFIEESRQIKPFTHFTQKLH